jgi:nitrite reductase/ring-hydroxylating ferredoxin subunit
MTTIHPEPICRSEQLAELSSLRFAVLYRGKPSPAIVLRFGGLAYGYLNACAHMGSELDQEDAEIFDDDGLYLRCTRHGVLYNPETGAALGSLCAGKALTPLRIEEQDGYILLADRHALLQNDAVDPQSY